MKKKKKKKIEEEINLLEVQPRETSKAFEAWTIYRDLGNHRTHKKVADHKGSDGKPVANWHTVEKWSSTWNWKERLRLTLLEREKTFKREEAEAIRAMIARHTRASLVLQNKSTERLNVMEGSELNPREALEYMKEGIRVERISRGEPDSISEVKENVLTKEEKEAEIKRLLNED